MSGYRNKRERSLPQIAVVAIFSAVSTLLFFLKFSVPFVPAFLTLDFSELPALLAGFALGPGAGVAVVLIKNLFHLFFTSTAGIGELANFLVGAPYVCACAVIYGKNKTQIGAVIAMSAGVLVMVIVGVLANYYVLMPLYSRVIPADALVRMFSSVNPKADTLFKITVFTIAPLNLFKGVVLLLSVLLLYKKLEPVINAAG